MRRGEERSGEVRRREVSRGDEEMRRGDERRREDKNRLTSQYDTCEIVAMITLDDTFMNSAHKLIRKHKKKT